MQKLLLEEGLIEGADVGQPEWFALQDGGQVAEGLQDPGTALGTRGRPELGSLAPDAPGNALVPRSCCQGIPRAACRTDRGGRSCGAGSHAAGRLCRAAARRGPAAGPGQHPLASLDRALLSRHPRGPRRARPVHDRPVRALAGVRPRCGGTQGRDDACLCRDAEIRRHHRRRPVDRVRGLARRGRGPGRVAPRAALPVVPAARRRGGFAKSLLSGRPTR